MKLEKIGKFIAQLRKEKNLTQAQLEELIDVDRKTISKWEHGQVAPDITILNDLASILDVTTYELLSGKRVENNKLNDDITVESIKYYSGITKKRISIFAIILFVIIVLSFVAFEYLSSYYDYNIRTISTQTENFQLNGKIIYNRNETILYINNILYADNVIGTTKEIKTKNIEVCLLEGDDFIISKNIESNSKSGEYLNTLLGNITLDYSDQQEKSKIKNYQDLNIVIKYYASNDDTKYITINLDFS